jgi:hypothetical protein
VFCNEYLHQLFLFRQNHYAHINTDINY